MEEPVKKHAIYDKIVQLRYDLNKTGGSEENGRVKAIVNTKLEEAELWATKLYEK